MINKCTEYSNLFMVYKRSGNELIHEHSPFHLSQEKNYRELCYHPCKFFIDCVPLVFYFCGNKILLQ